MIAITITKTPDNKYYANVFKDLDGVIEELAVSSIFEHLDDLIRESIAVYPQGIFTDIYIDNGLFKTNIKNVIS